MTFTVPTVRVDEAQESELPDIQIPKEEERNPTRMELKQSASCDAVMS